MHDVPFANLPLDIVPTIVEHLEHPRCLSVVCRVSGSFYAYAAPCLYKRIAVYAWHKDAKGKVLKLFRTLSSSPRLAFHVTRLDIRDFPKGLSTREDQEQDMVISGIQNCVNLRACTWTRDGTLNTAILEALSACPVLRDLEINGNSENRYSPALLSRFNDLQRLSLVMPSNEVILSLTRDFPARAGTLRTLSIIGKMSSVVTDDALELLAPYFSNLDNLHLAGCVKLTHRGVSAALSCNTNGIVSLGLEGMSSKFDIGALSERLGRHKALRRLRSITISLPDASRQDSWLGNIAVLLLGSPIELLHIYTTGPYMESTAATQFWSKMMEVHGRRLRRFSVHRMRLCVDQIFSICTSCNYLQELFVVAERASLEQLTECFSRALGLRVIHINYALQSNSDSPPVMTESEALVIVNKCPASIVQFGCNSRVWHVDRVSTVDRRGEIQVTRRLLRYEGQDIPEQFLVVRT